MSAAQSKPTSSTNRRFDSPDAARAFVSEVIGRAPGSEPFDALGVLNATSDLLKYKSVVLDLAYEEYCRKADAGQTIDPDSFVRRFPDYQKSLLNLIQVHHFLEDRVEQFGDRSISWPEAQHEFLGFQLVEEIGRGAFSRVFVATETALANRRVVLKLCFQANYEANTLAQLQHPYIVPVYSLHDDPLSRLTAICMPFLSRATLFDVLDHVFAQPQPPSSSRVIEEAICKANTPGPAERAGDEARRDLARQSGDYNAAIVRIGAQLADALEYTHQKQILHCDIKPSNVLLTDAGEALLFDFNLAVSEIPGNNIGGTLPYMAPEQLRIVASGQRQPSTDALSPQTDLFALGATLYQLLAGQLPFGRVPSGGSSSDVAARLLERQQEGPQPLRSWNPSVSPTLARTIERCLRFEPADRPPSAGELAAELRAEFSLWRRGLDWVRRNRRATIASALIGAVLLLAVTVALALRTPETVREYRLGVAAAEAGDDAQALEHFAAALAADEENAAALFARGRSLVRMAQHEEDPLVRLEHYEEARGAFVETRKLVRDGRVTACLADCVVRLGIENRNPRRWKLAIGLYHEALEEGFTSAALLNNLGHAYYESKNFELARKYLTASIDADEQLQAAYHNLARIELKIPSDDGPNLSFVRRALETGPVSTGLLGIAAKSHAAAASFAKGPRATALLEQALDYYDQALKAGFSASELNQVAKYNRVLLEHPRFKRLQQQPRSSRPRTEAQQMLDPLLDCDDLLDRDAF